MAIGTSSLLALIGAGFLLIIIGLPWWIGISIIVLTMAVVANDNDSAKAIKSARQETIYTNAMMDAANNTVRNAPPKKKEEFGSVQDPLQFRPSIPPDGVAGIKAYGPTGSPLTVGGRTGTASFYATGTDTNIGRIRIKDDIRLNMPFMSDKAGDGTKVMTNLLTAHFRTGKPILKTKCLDSTFDTIKTGFDEWAQE